MKILTILVFSGDRFNVKDLLNDIAKLDISKIKVAVVEWSENKDILFKKKKIYRSFRKKIKDFKVYFQRGNWEYKYSKFIYKFNSKYILVIGDDDRINIKNFNKIFKHLNSDFSGITTSFTNFKEEKDLKFKNNLSVNQIKPFNLSTDLNKIGFTSCQIINVKYLSKILKKEKKYLLKTKFPQNFLILKLISKYKNWKISDLNCIYNRLGKFDDKWINENLITRLKSEYLGYLIPLKRYFPYLDKKNINKIYIHIFFKNIISWLFLSLKYFGKRKTYKSIQNERKIYKEPLLLKITLILIYFSPIFFLNILRILRSIYRKIFIH